jgi:hypothetical protein
MAKYFRRTVYSIELLEEIASDLELEEGTIDDPEEVLYAMTNGSASGKFTVEETELITPQKMVELCHQHGTDPTYFGLVALDSGTNGRDVLVKAFEEPVEVTDWMWDKPELAYGVKVALAELGEGKSGDYDEEDPNDEEYLRFDVSFIYFEDDGTETEYQPQDHSFCTELPVTLSGHDRVKAMQFIMDKVFSDMSEGNEVSNLLERLSWINPTWLTDEPDAAHQHMVVNNPYAN